MSTFEDEGFLSTSMDEWSRACLGQYPEWFVLCREFNRYCVQLLPKLAHNNRQKHLTVALFLRLLSLFESSIILTERCMVNETKIQLRAMMETLFTLKAVSIDETTAERYYYNNIWEKREALRRYKRYGSDDLLKGLDLDKRLEELNGVIRQKRIVQLTTKDLAEKAGLSDFYVSAYPVLSWTAHSNVIDIGQYIHGESDEEIEEVSWHPLMEGVDKLLLTAMECTIIGLQSVTELFSLDAAEEIEKYSQRYHKLAVANKKPRDG